MSNRKTLKSSIVGTWLRKETKDLCEATLGRLCLHSLFQWLHQLESDLVGYNFNSPIFSCLSAVCCLLTSGASVARISNTYMHCIYHLSFMKKGTVSMLKHKKHGRKVHLISKCKNSNCHMLPAITSYKIKL